MAMAIMDKTIMPTEGCRLVAAASASSALAGLALAALAQRGAQRASGGP